MSGSVRGRGLVALACAVAVGLVVVAIGGAQADPPAHLAHLRQRLQTFDTLWMRVEKRRAGGGSGMTSCVLRADRATGRASFDCSSYRALWDGTHAWFDMGPNAPSRLGDDVDAKVAALMTELLGGFPNTMVVPPLVEDWGGRTQSGWRLDLPFTWDDDYAILVTGREDRDPTGLQLIVKATKEPAQLGSSEFRVLFKDIGWNVRLLDDLTEPENIGSRRTLISPPNAVQDESIGPSMLPGYHVETTTHALWFDAASSAGATPYGEEVPMAMLPDQPCGAAGEAYTAPISLRYTLDPAAESSLFLADALAAGCPMRWEMYVVHRHRAQAGARTRITGLMRVRDLSTTPPTVLGTRAFDETLTDRTANLGRLHEVQTTAPFTPGGIEVTFDGSLQLTCSGPTGPNRIEFGTKRDRPPVLSWLGCYPELGVIPDP